MAPHSAHLSVFGCSDTSGVRIKLGVSLLTIGLISGAALAAAGASGFGASAAFGGAGGAAAAGAAEAGAGCDSAGLADDTRAGGTTGDVGPPTDVRDSS